MSGELLAFYVLAGAAVAGAAGGAAAGCRARC